MQVRTATLMRLDWMKCQSGNWCGFFDVDLNHQHFDGMEGVYIIWHGGQNPATVYTGQGFIRDRIRDHRSESSILRFESYGLSVTWAEVAPSFRDGVERFLANQLSPKVGDRHPLIPPISVNLPWS